MKLHYTKSSPFAACVRAVISEHSAENMIELIESHPFDNDAEFLVANPLGKVPCLVADPDLGAIFDSEVICDYLDATISGGILFENIYADWRLKTFYSLCYGLMDAGLSLQVESLREKDGLKSDFWYDRHYAAINRSLNEIESRLQLLPENFTIIHLTLVCALQYLDFRHPSIEWRVEREALVSFYQNFKDRECFEYSKLS